MLSRSERHTPFIYNLYMYIIYSRSPVTMFLQPAAESRLTNARERREVLVDYHT